MSHLQHTKLYIYAMKETKLFLILTENLLLIKNKVFPVRRYALLFLGYNGNISW